MNDIPLPILFNPWLSRLHLAAVFLTRLPLPDPGWPAEGLAPAMAIFPVVGAGLGLGAGLVFLLAHALLPPLAAALSALLALTLASGALHEDGLADFADGLGARGDRAQRLEAMRDSRTGVYGALSLVFGTLLAAAGLAAAPSGLAGLGALTAAAALGRAAIPAAMQVLPPARPDGLGAGAGQPHAGTAALALVLGLGLAIAGLGWRGALVGAILATVGVLVVTLAARRHLGGHTGDVLGAVARVAEVAVLLAAAGIWR